MSNTTFVEKMLNSGAIVKLSHCFENKGPADIPSCLYYGTGHGHEIVPMTSDDEPLVWLMAALTTAYAEHGHFVEVGFVSDAFGREFENVRAVTEFIGAKKSLEDEFREKPDSDVQEILVAYAVFGDGTEAGGLMSYWYGDDGLPTFGKPLLSTDEQGGPIPLLLRTFHSFLQQISDEG